MRAYFFRADEIFNIHRFPEYIFYYCENFLHSNYFFNTNLQFFTFELMLPYGLRLHEYVQQFYNNMCEVVGQ